MSDKPQVTDITTEVQLKEFAAKLTELLIEQANKGLVSAYDLTGGCLGWSVGVVASMGASREEIHKSVDEIMDKIDELKSQAEATNVVPLKRT